MPNKPLTIVLYTEGLSFTGDTLKYHPLGGAETALIYVAGEMTRLGHKVTVYCPCTKEGVYDGVVYKDRSKIAECTQKECDLFLCSRFFFIFDLDIRASVRVLWMHDILIPNLAYYLKRYLDRIDVVYCLSNYHRDTTLQVLPAAQSRLRVTANGLDFALVKEALQTAGAKKHRIMFTSRPERGLMQALDFYERLNDTGLEFLICTYPYIQNSDIQNLENQCMQRVTGLTERGFPVSTASFAKHDLYRNIAESKAVIYPCNSSEIFCISAIEAQACGTVFLTIDEFAMKETVGYKGVAPGDAEGFYQRLEAILEDEGFRAELEARGRQHVCQYSWKSVARRFIDDYVTVLTQRGIVREDPLPVFNRVGKRPSPYAAYVVCQTSLPDFSPKSKPDPVSIGIRKGRKIVSNHRKQQKFQKTVTPDRPTQSKQPIYEKPIKETHMSIPKIIHQTWKKREVPTELAILQRTWLANHPGWEYRFWTDEDNREFLQRHYDWFLPIYDGYPVHIMRVDAVRCFILHHYGGVYADLDMECLKPLDPFLEGKQLVLGLEPVEHLNLIQARERSMEKIIGNAFLASRPGHPFWEHVFEQLVTFRHLPNPLDATGPYFLTKTYDRFPRKETITLESPELLYPIHNEENWRHLQKDSEKRDRIYSRAFTIHHWHGSWWKPEAPTEEEEKPCLVLQEGMIVSQSMFREIPPDKENLPKISCLMVTKGRMEMAKRAIHCFCKQTYINKELVIVEDDEDDSLEQWVKGLKDASIVYVRLLPKNKPLGELRNISVQAASGAYVAQWDDDDISAPERLEMEMAAIRMFKTDACFLYRHQIWWPQRRLLCLSPRRIWEGSILCAKDKLPLYPSHRKGEDTPVTMELVSGGRVAVLDFPQLYTYVFHGDNTFDAQHFEAHVHTATEIYKDDMYEAMLAQMREKLKLDL